MLSAAVSNRAAALVPSERAPAQLAMIDELSDGMAHSHGSGEVAGGQRFVCQVEDSSRRPACSAPIRSASRRFSSMAAAPRLPTSNMTTRSISSAASVRLTAKCSTTVSVPSGSRRVHSTRSSASCSPRNGDELASGDAEAEVGRRHGSGSEVVEDDRRTVGQRGGEVVGEPVDEPVRLGVACPQVREPARKDGAIRGDRQRRFSGNDLVGSRPPRRRDPPGRTVRFASPGLSLGR